MLRRNFILLTTIVAVSAASGCATAGNREDPRIFKKIGVKDGCDVFQTYDAPTERHYRVDCPSTMWNKPATKGVTLLKGAGDPRIKCRVTYAVSSQPAYDYTNFNNKWVSATTIKCWGPRVAGDL